MISTLSKRLYFLVLLLTISMTSHGFDWPTGKGDVTGDGIIDGRDALVILQHLEGIIILTPDQIELGDVHPNPGIEGRRIGDGRLTREDAQTILDHTVGLIPLGDLTGDYSLSKPVIEALVPLSGRIGDEVTLIGRNFPTGHIANTEVHLGQARAEIVSITGSMITITVPKGAISGRFHIQSPGGTTFSPMTFSVLDTIQGALKVDGDLDPRNFMVFSTHDFQEIESTEGAFTLYGPNDAMTLYQAATFDTDNPNVYEYYYIPGYTPLNEPILIDALSTAKVMVFTHPFIVSDDENHAARLFDYMANLPEVHELASIISQKFPLEVNGADDPDIALAWENAIYALLQHVEKELRPGSADDRNMRAKQVNQGTNSAKTPLAPPSASFRNAIPTNLGNSTSNTKIYGIDFDFLRAVYRKIDHSVILGMGEVEYDFDGNADKITGGYSPVDWFITMYKLNPEEYPYGLQTPFFTFQSHKIQKPLHKSSMAVSANLWTAKIDIVYHVTEMLTEGGLYISGIEEMLDELIHSEKKGTLPLLENPETDEDGLYIIHGFSGALHTWFDDERKDFSSIQSIEDGMLKMYMALTGNAIQIVIDIVDLCTADAKRWTRAFTKKAIKNCSRAISRDLPPTFFEKKPSMDEITTLLWGVIIEGLKAGTTTLPQYVVTSLQESINPAAALKLSTVQEKSRTAMMQRLSKSLSKPLKILAFLDKTSSLGRISERFAGLMGRLINVYDFELSPGPSPLESAIVVVGDPFSPRIDSFSPMSGPPGSEMVIHGSRFSSILEENTVWIGLDQAEVISVEGREKLTVRVPNEHTNFAYNQSYGIKIETPGMMKPGFSDDNFVLKRIPVISSIEPYLCFPSVSNSTTGPFRGYRSKLSVHGMGLMSNTGIVDQYFIDHQLTNDYLPIPSNRIDFILPENIRPGVHEFYIISPENNNFTTPPVQFEILGPPEAFNLNKGKAKAGEFVTINGMFLGEDVFAVTVNDIPSPEVKRLSDGKLLFRMPTVGKPGEILLVQAHSPSGMSEVLLIEREAGFIDAIPSLPVGYTMYVGSTKGGFDPEDRFLTLDEAASIARGESNPYLPPWDDQNEEWIHHFYQTKHVDSQGNHSFDWQENDLELEIIYLPGGPGDEYRKHYRVDHYHPDQGGSTSNRRLTDSYNLDEGDENKEKGDFVTGQTGGEEYADRILINNSDPVFHAVNFLLGDNDSLHMSDRKLQLGGRGIQINSNCSLELGEVICELGDAITITGVKNTVKGKIVRAGKNGVVINEGVGNTLQVSVENCDGYGILINRGGDNRIGDTKSWQTKASHTLFNAAKGGVFINIATLTP